MWRVRGGKDRVWFLIANHLKSSNPIATCHQRFLEDFTVVRIGSEFDVSYNGVKLNSRFFSHQRKTLGAVQTQISAKAAPAIKSIT